MTPSVSTDPLGGQVFTTPVFDPPVTYTVVTTYSTNTPVTESVLTGSAGGSPATQPYTFTYSPPVSSATGTDQSSIYSSLAANAEPTQYTSQLVPDTDNLQIVDGALPMHAWDYIMTVCAMAAAGVAGALWVL